MPKPTPSNPTGPAYRRDAPFRVDLSLGRRGTRLVASGRVLDREGLPWPGLVLDIWHAGPRGAYGLVDRAMRFRGRVRTDDEGRWSLRSVVPGGYLWRPPHLHVKVWDDDRLRLTTQLYFPGDLRLRLDPHPRPELMLAPRTVDGVVHVAHDLVLPARVRVPAPA